MADLGQFNLFCWLGKRTDLMQQGEAIRYAPLLNKLPAAKATNFDYVDCDWPPGRRINACRPATLP